MTKYHSSKIESSKHLEKIRGMSCIICNSPPRCDPHHITYAEESGMGAKVGDNWTVPLCRKCHGDLHMYKYGEKLFWATMGIDPLEKAKEFYGSKVTKESI
tara:strand:- start:1177 stop:1479 length:303 start_codon:yes stop_codon:yes gene_type:complete